MLSLYLRLVKYKLLRVFTPKDSDLHFEAFEFECKTEKAIKNYKEGR